MPKSDLKLWITVIVVEMLQVSAKDNGYLTKHPIISPLHLWFTFLKWFTLLQENKWHKTVCSLFTSTWSRELHMLSTHEHVHIFPTKSKLCLWNSKHVRETGQQNMAKQQKWAKIWFIIMLRLLDSFCFRCRTVGDFENWHVEK